MAQNLLPVSTFSIVAHDPDSDALGIAVQSKFLGVGSVVPWAKAGIGAIATQAWAHTGYGPQALDLLAEGLDVTTVAERLTTPDPDRESRQFGLVDNHGRAHAYTGGECMDWAGHVIGENFTCQGNILAGGEVVQAMAEAYRQAQGDLAARLVKALHAGQGAGGDRRGRQSAAIFIVREKGGYGGFNDRYMDLRVDDHQDPIQELERLTGIWRLYFAKEETPVLLPLEGDTLQIVQSSLQHLGYLKAVSRRLDEPTRIAMAAFHGAENFEEREHRADVIDQVVLGFLQQKAASLD